MRKHFTRGLAVASLAAIVATSIVSGASLAAATSPEAGTIGLTTPKTDNYKALFNADPEAVELQSWLSFHAVTLNGVTYTLATAVGACNNELNWPSGASGIALTGSDGSSAKLQATTS